jgi:hypothetical protein
MKKLTPRTPKTSISVFGNNSPYSFATYEHNLIANFYTLHGTLEIFFTDGSQITYGPAWCWKVSEEAE